MKTYLVTLPIGGHAFVTVEAENEEQAKALAMDEVTRDDIEDWEVLNPVSRGNVLRFPTPWEIEVEEE